MNEKVFDEISKSPAQLIKEIEALEVENEKDN